MASKQSFDSSNPTEFFLRRRVAVSGAVGNGGLLAFATGTPLDAAEGLFFFVTRVADGTVVLFSVSAVGSAIFFFGCARSTGGVGDGP